MNALSLDLRQRIVAAVDAGMSQSEAARRFAVSRATVHRLLWRRRESGTLEAKPRPGAKRRIAPEQHARLQAQLCAFPDDSLAQQGRRWHQEQGHRVSETTLWRTLQRMGWSHKKRVCVPASETKPREPRGARA